MYMVGIALKIADEFLYEFNCYILMKLLKLIKMDYYLCNMYKDKGMHVNNKTYS